MAHADRSERRDLGRYRQRTAWRRRLGTDCAAIGHLQRWCHRAAGTVPKASAPDVQRSAVARIAMDRLATDSELAAAARPLPRVLAADRWHRRRGGAWPGAYGIPPGRCRA